MKRWSVESLSHAGMGAVVVLAGATTSVALHQVAAPPAALLGIIGALTGIAILVSIRIGQLTSAHRKTCADLSSSERRYAHLVETAHEGIWVLDHQGKTVYANRRLAEIFGCKHADLLQRGIADHLSDNPPDVLASLLLSDSAAGRSYDLIYRHARQSPGWAMVSARPLADDDGVGGRSLLMLTDITERKAAELALAAMHISLEVRIRLRTAELEEANAQLRAEIKVREAAECALALSEQRLQNVVTTMPLPLFIKDAQSRVIMMNRAAEEQWGLPFAQISGTRGSAWFPSDQMARFISDDQAAFAGRKQLVLEEEMWNAVLGENRLVQTYKKPVYDAQGAPNHLICMLVDITDHKRVEDALRQSFAQLRQLSAHLDTIKEEERKKFALEIHDDLGQNLLALKLDVEMLHTRAGARHPHLKERVGHVLETIDASIRSVRAIMNDLHPSTLELGLPAALEWLVDQFKKRSGVDTTLSVMGDDGQLPDMRLTSVIFRIIQETLVNILRHAQASHVEVMLTIAPDYLSIVIVDDGVGMQPGDAGKAAAFGLRSIQERVDVFGGELVIDSRPGNGTTLSIMIPQTSTIGD
jgi:two-component system sensor histidine kinase UhpB